MEQKSKELQVAIEAALGAGKILEKYFETEILREFKEDKSIVTLADNEAEKIIREILSHNFPEHSILGEELGLIDKQSAYTWYIDPIDGTTNFANGIPLFGVSIALVKQKDILVSVIYNPITRNLFYAEKNKGAYLNNRRVFVSKDNKDKGIATASASKKTEDQELRGALIYHMAENIRSVRYFGSTVIDLSYVARGGIEATIQLGLQPYDFVAGILLVQEAGGQVTRLDGSHWEFPEQYFIASNGIFHATLVAEIEKQKEKLGLS